MSTEQTTVTDVFNAVASKHELDYDDQISLLIGFIEATGGSPKAFEAFAAKLYEEE